MYDEIYIVAHSHGGSVVAYAFREYPQVDSYVDGVITLATPWITARPDRFAAENRVLLFRFSSFLLLTILILSILPMLVVPLAESASPYFPLLAPNTGNEFDDALNQLARFFAVAGVLAIFLAIMLGISWTQVHKRIIKRMVDGQQAFTERLDQYARSLCTADVRMSRCVIILASNDEASSSLKVMQALSVICRELAGKCAQAIFLLLQKLDTFPAWLKILCNIVVIVSFTIVVSWIGVFDAIDGVLNPERDLPRPAGRTFHCEWIDEDAGNVLEIAHIGVLGMLVSATAIILASTLSFGAKNFFSQIYCRFGVEPCPHGEAKIILINTSTQVDSDKAFFGGSLNHSGVYLLESAVTTICRAISSLRTEQRAR